MTTNKKKDKWEEELARIFNVEVKGNNYGEIVEYNHIESAELFIKTRDFFSTLLSEQKKELREKFIEIAIEGGAEKDEMKGLLLYTKFLKYLDERR